MIFKIEDIGKKKILSNDRIQFNCSRCDKLVKQRYFTFKNSKSELCKECKTEQTNINKYGCKSPLQLKKSRKAQKVARKNTTEDVKINAEIKRKQTCLEKYGVDNPAKLNEIKQRIEQTNLLKFGSHPMQNKNIKQKVIKTNLERYGVENVLQDAKIKQKIIETCLEKYGVENFAQSKKFKKIMTEKYGAKYSFQSKKIKEKIYNTMIEKYGKKHALQNEELFSKAMSSYNLETINENLHYQTKPELKCIKYCQLNNIKIWDGPSIQYDWNNEKHIYHIDFETNKYLIEIKGSHGWYQENLKNGKIDAKNKAAQEYAASINKEFLFLLDVKDYSKYIKEL